MKRAQVILLAIIVTAMVALAVGVSSAQTVDTSSFEGESMTETVSPGNQDVVADTSASGGRTRRFTDPATASKSVTPTGAIDTLSVTFRNTKDNSARGTLKVLVDGVQAVSNNSAADSYTTVSAPASMAAGSSHTIEASASSMSGNRKIFVDKVDLTGPDTPPPPDVVCPTGGINVTPSQDLSAVAASNSGSKTYCLAPGTYTVSQDISVEGADKFLGLSTDPTQVKVKSNGTQTYGSSGSIVSGSTVDHVFNTGPANGAVFENLDISGGVHNNTCEPDCGRGIGSGGSNMTVRNSKIHDNENAGIGAPGSGLQVFDTEIYHNGNVDSARDGGPVSAAGVKGSDPGGSTTAPDSPGYSLSVFNSNIHDNYWTGIWCDIGCEQFEVHDSNVSNNGKAGIHDEISFGPAVFEGNTIKNNGGLSTANQHTGLLIVSSINAEAFGNTFGGNVSEGVKLMEDSRPPVLGNVRIHDNTMSGDSLVGCSLPGVTCANNG